MLLQSSFCCQEEKKLTKEGEGEELEYAYILDTGTKINTRGYIVFLFLLSAKARVYIQCCNNSRRSMSSRFYEQLYASTDNRKENAIERDRSRQCILARMKSRTADRTSPM